MTALPLRVWADGQWVDIGGLPGAAGADGTDGTDGAPGVKGDTGSKGDQGVKGDTGAAGTAGVGVPSGGSTGRLLAKLSGSNYDTGWVAPPAPPPVMGQLLNSTATGAVSNTASSPTRLTDQITIPVAGKLSVRQALQMAPQTGQGSANRAQPSPVLAGIELANANNTVVLAADLDWSEGYVLDNGYGLYGLCSLHTELFYDTSVAAGTYTVRAVLACVRASGQPNAFVQRRKIKWTVFPT